MNLEIKGKIIVSDILQKFAGQAIDGKLYVSTLPPFNSNLQQYTHPYFRLIIGVSGSYKFKYYSGGLKDGLLGEGDILITMANGGLLFNEFTAPFKIISLIFWYDLIRYLITDESGAEMNNQWYHTSKPVSTGGKYIIQALSEFSDSNDFAFARKKLVEALIHISLNEINNDIPIKKGKSFSTFHSIINYIRNNMYLKIDRAKMAKELGISPSHISKLFKMHSNTDFSNALNQIRIEHAIELLNKTPLAVSEIANLCGFKSSTHFIRVFKKLNGTTPIAFRSRAHDMGTIQAYEKSKEAKPFPWKISLPSN